MRFVLIATLAPIFGLSERTAELDRSLPAEAPEALVQVNRHAHQANHSVEGSAIAAAAANLSVGRHAAAKIGSSSEAVAASGASVVHNATAVVHNKTVRKSSLVQNETAAQSKLAEAAVVPPAPPGDKDAVKSDDSALVKAEKNAEHEEKTGLFAGVAKLASAVQDPRGFFMQMDAIKAVDASLRLTISLQGGDAAGKCLTTNDYGLEGLGCLSGPGVAPLCKCAGLLELCWAPGQEEEDQLLKMFSSGKQEQALEIAKAMLFGKCNRPIWLVCVVVAAGVLGLILLLVVLRLMMRKPASRN